MIVGTGSSGTHSGLPLWFSFLTVVFGLIQSVEGALQVYEAFSV